MIESRKAADDIETFHLIVKKGFNIKLQILNTSMDYTVFASTYCPPHYGITVKVTHENRNKGARMAINSLYQAIKEESHV